jgi:hypothetical protein
VARIDATLTGAERKAALCMLLDQETQLLASIGRHKLDANAESRQKFIIEFLEKVCRALYITHSCLSNSLWSSSANLLVWMKNDAL